MVASTRVCSCSRSSGIGSCTAIYNLIHCQYCSKCKIIWYLFFSFNFHPSIYVIYFQGSNLLASYVTKFTFISLLREKKKSCSNVSNLGNFSLHLVHNTDVNQKLSLLLSYQFICFLFTFPR